ncbi:mitochondrial Rho GTPase [Suhomyces tanzawaensis NRRL Y-17324]|uniref:Mitochondrial Rho GTPase n=1 Tax=Suhomyces tanzawaensis NRRL Y-17324 TaxID=984487 RepID=A0A1E4SIX7_9ASCO|nr:mitochondrial Rho GTPase [Suhomyces tanzawaensis NRRL Y-17324]ODV79454.1 mitochondrial Rho GTPase [Suhomyces tanzawaensis NRRL Y-17324]
MMADTLRVVVCGDDSVGKSSLITSLIKEQSVSSVLTILPPITISKADYTNSIEGADAKKNPRKGDNTPANRVILQHIPNKTVVVDTTSTDIVSLQKELKRADVIWLVYSDHYTYERISLHWMPMFRSMGVNLPIILCANKSDIIPKGTSIKTLNSDEFIPLINEFKEIEACVRCSAKTNYNVVEAFYLCQRAITHPISPIFDSKEGNLKPAAIAALKRVFFLCDKDQDGYLDYKEFSDLHVKCFERDSSSEEFDNIISSINAVIFPEAKASKKISEDGFILLNKMYAETGRYETVWGILRAFHYTNSLSLNDRFLFPQLDVNPNSSVELSPTGYRFLVDLFLKFDKDNDGGLNEEELNNLFIPTPGIPMLWQDSQFPASIVCNEEGYVTLQGWLAQWNLTTFLEHKTTLEYLAYLGFDDGASIKAIKVTKPRKRRQKQSKFYRQAVNDRNIFNCFILGAPKAGKSSLLELFLRGSYSDVYNPTIRPRLCVKDIELRGGKQCYLILEELGELEPAILSNQLRLDQCDVICYAYDSSDPESFQYLVDLRNKHSHALDEIPSIFVALKADLDKQQQRSDVQPENYTRDLFLNSPLHISSAWTTSLHELFIQLVDAAKAPSTATPGLETEPESNENENLKHIVMAGGALTIMTAVSIWIWRSSLQSSRA